MHSVQGLRHCAAVIETLETRRLLTATLIKDINSIPLATNNTVNQIYTLGSVSYFAQNDGVHGAELWKTDGTTAGTTLVKDIWPGASGSVPNTFTNMGGTLYFAADDGVHGTELFKSDGTATGTQLVADINPGIADSQPTNLMSNGLLLFFFADDGVHGRELWKSDGTAAGTALVKDIQPGSAGQSPRYYNVSGSAYNPIALSNGVILFGAVEGSTGSVWRSDGSAAGTYSLGTAGFYSSRLPNLFTQVGSYIYFADASVGFVFRTDGVSAPTAVDTTNSAVQNMVGVGNSLYYTRSSSLIEVDASTNTPTTLRPIGGNIAGIGSTLYFLSAATTGSVLYTSVAGSNTTTQIASFGSGSTAGNGTNVNGTLFFTEHDATGFHVYKSGGSPGTTLAVSNLTTSAGTSVNPAVVATVGSHYLFVADSTSNGAQLWQSEGTSAGTAVLKNISPLTNPSQPLNMTSTPLGVFFDASDGIHGRELWLTDGTATGTVMVKDINPGPSSSDLFGYTYFKGKVYFRATEGVNGDELWQSDGTAAGTTMVADINSGSVSSSPNSFAVLGDWLYFQATTTATGAELYRVNSTGAVQLVKDINPGAGDSDPSNLRVVNNHLIFSDYSDGSTVSFWSSDGTVAGTIPLMAGMTPVNISNSYHPPAVINNVFYFSASTAAAGTELWRTDGTAAGTYQVADIQSGSGSSSPYAFSVVGSTLYFGATTTAYGTELWKSDGTAAGTTLVIDLNPGTTGSGIVTTAALGSKLIFAANDGTLGTEPYVTSGTAATTLLLKDVFPGSTSSITTQPPFSVVGGGVFFSANDGVHGLETWSTDGTTAGTTLVDDTYGGEFGGNPSTQVVSYHGKLIAALVTDIYIDEPYLITDNLAPQLQQSQFNNGVSPSLRFQFSEDVSASLSVADLTIVNQTTGATVSASLLTLSYDPTNNVASATWNGGTLPNGKYVATVHASAVTDVAGNPLVSDTAFQFILLAGDANSDGKVDIADLGVLATNYGQSGMTLAQGDFNFDGKVDIADLGILATDYGINLN